MSYTVIFLDTKGPAKLGTYADKGLCRRAWRTCNAGAAILGPDGALLECKSGTTAAAEKKLTAYAEHLRRQGGMATETAPARRAAPVAVVEVEAEAADEERAELDEEPAPAPPTRLAPTVKPVPVAAPPPPAPALKVGDVVSFPGTGPLGRCFAVVRALVGIGALVEFDNHGQPFSVDRDSITRDGEGWTCSTPFPAPPVAAPRPAEVTHALHPATGAVVQGDDTERLTPAKCGAMGCDAAPGIDRSNVRPAWRPFCGACRAVIRERSRSFPGGEEAVIEHMREGTLPPARRGPVSKKAAPKRTAKVVAHRDPKPTRAPSPARTLAAGLERVKRHAAVVDALGGVEAAEQLAAAVRDAGGVAVVVDALTELRSVA